MSHWMTIVAAVLALLVLATLMRHWAEKSEARHTAPPGEWVNVNGRRIHLRRVGQGNAGNGPNIVIEAGGGSSSPMWWPLQDRLADMATVVTYDRAGLGWSEAAVLPRTIEQRADELHAVLKAADIPGPYVLVGLSYGGPLIRVFAARHRELVAGMVFVDISHEAVFASAGAQTYIKRCAAALRIIGVLAAIGVPRLLRLRGIPESPTSLRFSAEQRRILQSRFPTAQSFRTGADEFGSMRRIAEAMRGLDAPGCYGALPISVVSHGKTFPGPFAVLEQGHMEGQKALAALSSNSELVVAANSSHAIPLEEPAVVLDAVRRVWHAAHERRPLVSGARPVAAPSPAPSSSHLLAMASAPAR
jgi:pimeloyl-ACP methyl ester carboxylesterase